MLITPTKQIILINCFNVDEKTLIRLKKLNDQKELNCINFSKVRTKLKLTKTRGPT